MELEFVSTISTESFGIQLLRYYEKQHDPSFWYSCVAKYLSRTIGDGQRVYSSVSFFAGNIFAYYHNWQFKFNNFFFIWITGSVWKKCYSRCIIFTRFCTSNWWQSYLSRIKYTESNSVNWTRTCCCKKWFSSRMSSWVQ
jgi:hypothetical protein